MDNGGDDYDDDDDVWGEGEYLYEPSAVYRSYIFSDY